MQVITNARIYTQNPAQPFATAIAIHAGRVLALGDDASVLASFQDPPAIFGRPERLDAGGRAILPGLIDAHLHLQHYALGLQSVDCETDTLEECLHRVEVRARQTPPGEWIRGHGWNHNLWPGGYGTRQQLDNAAPGRPVYLTAKSLHAAWASSLALGEAGINAGTPDPSGGEILRDERGQPTGILLESAMALVEGRLPRAEGERLAKAIAEAIPGLWKMGLTGVHDFDGRDSFSALQALRSRGELRLRVVKSLPLELLPEAIALGLRSGFGDDLLRIGQVKVFADGALGPRTAAMLQGYAGEVENRGKLLVDGEELFEIGRRAADNGLALAVHAIGDRANHEVLQGFRRLHTYVEERYPEAEERVRLRQRIEHVQLIHPQDVPSLAEAGVIASMQPLHATSDMLMAERYWGERSANGYAWKRLVEHGARLAFGSDAPVESPSPMLGIHAAVTRRRQDGSPGADGWYPEQRLSIAAAVQAFTTGAAYAGGQEAVLGQLAPGTLADLVILDQDPYTCAPEDLWRIQPLAVMLGGEWMFSSV